MRLALYIFLAISHGFPAFVSGDDWPNWRGPRFNGVSREKIPVDLPDSLPVLWTADVGTGFSSFSVVGNRVLTMGNRDEKDTVWCLDAETGNVLWKHTYDCPLDPLYYEGGPGGTPTVHDGAVYTLSKKGHAFCLDLNTGKVLWSRNLVEDHDLKLPEWSFACSALIEGERVLLNAGRKGIALDRNTGKTLWLTDPDTSGYATFVPYLNQTNNRNQHLLFSAKSLLSIDSRNGKINWEYPWKSSRDVNAADPLIVGNDIVVSSAAGTKRLRPSDDGSPPVDIWHQRDLKWYFNPGVLIDDHIYSIHGTTHRPTELTCTHAETGETIWAEEGYGSGGLIAADRNIILFDLGKLTIFKATAEGFQPVVEQSILEGKCWTSPVVANGRIFCRNAAGNIAAVRVSVN
ncbi:MAG: PQQ-like beta-propeller repeat protein [Verrucomicrobiales bacterium]|nr:PQQ-like beta-propeller repeat protein [Verrucomicrobiales bacterium]